LRLSFWHLRFGSVDPTFKVFTDVFSVSPGRLRSIEVVTEPSVRSFHWHFFGSSVFMFAMLHASLSLNISACSDSQHVKTLNICGVRA
jgi:hypothetical protein